MNYKIREQEGNLHITGHLGLLSASLSEWTSSRAKIVLGRDLVDGEKFYWLNKIFNQTDKQGERTKLLHFVLNIAEERRATLGLIASPDLPGGDEIVSQESLEERLTRWSKRHGFYDTPTKYPALVRTSPRFQQKIPE